MTETVLINVKLEGTENEAKINSLSKSINDLNEENKKLIENNKKLAKAEGDNSAEIAKNSSQIELNKQKISESSASRKGLIQTIVAEDNSIKALSVRNAELRKQRDLINTSTDEGRKKIQQINAEIDKNNSVIKDNNDALGAQKINIGNYASALDSVVPGLSGMVSGIQGATKASLAFIATPLGAVLAALGLAIAAVAKYFTASEEGADKFAKISAQASAIIDVLVDRVVMLGGALVAFATGDFSGGVDKLSKSFDGLGDEIEREVKLAGELTDALDQLEERELQYGLTVSQTGNNIKNLIIQSKNRSLTEAERIKKLEEAFSLENKLTEDALSIEEERLRIANEKILADFSQFDISRKRGESEIDFARRITKDERILFSEREKLAEFIKKYDTIIDNSQNLQEKIQNQKDALADRETANQEKRNAAAEKELENIRKIQEAEDKAYIEKLKRQDEDDNRIYAEIQRIVEKIEAEELAKDLGLEFEQEKSEFEQEKSDKLDEFTEKAIERGRRVAEFNKKYNAEITKSEQVKNQQMASLQSQAFALGSQLAGKNKTLQTGLALTSTYFSAQKAYESQFIPIADITSPVRGAIAAAIAVASGLANVASINGIKFAKGGIAAIGGLLSGPSHSQGGIPFSVGGRLGFEAEGGEAIINKRSTAMYAPLLSQINQAGGGRAFALGGMTGNEVRSASSFASGQFNANQIASLINQVKIVQVLQDFEAVQYSRNNDVVKATVIS